MDRENATAVRTAERAHTCSNNTAVGHLAFTRHGLTASAGLLYPPVQLTLPHPSASSSGRISSVRPPTALTLEPEARWASLRVRSALCSPPNAAKSPWRVIAHKPEEALGTELFFVDDRLTQISSPPPMRSRTYRMAMTTFPPTRAAQGPHPRFGALRWPLRLQVEVAKRGSAAIRTKHENGDRSSQGVENRGLQALTVKKCDSEAVWNASAHGPRCQHGMFSPSPSSLSYRVGFRQGVVPGLAVHLTPSLTVRCCDGRPLTSVYVCIFLGRGPTRGSASSIRGG